MALIITTDYVTDETFFFYQSTATHIKSANDDNSDAFIIDELINSKDKHSANIRRNFLMRVKCFVFFVHPMTDDQPTRKTRNKRSSCARIDRLQQRKLTNEWNEKLSA